MRTVSKHEVLRHSGSSERDQFRVLIGKLNFFILIEYRVSEQAFIQQSSRPSSCFDFGVLAPFLPNLNTSAFYLPSNYYQFEFGKILSHLDIHRYLEQACKTVDEFEIKLYKWISELKTDVSKILTQSALLWGNELGYVALKEHPSTNLAQIAPFSALVQYLIVFIYGPPLERHLMMRKLTAQTLEYELRSSPSDRLSKFNKRTQTLCSNTEVAILEGFLMITFPQLRYERERREVHDVQLTIETFNLKTVMTN